MRKANQILLIAWITYASFYLCRANLSIAIPLIEGDLDFSKTVLGMLGSSLLAGYAIGQVIHGQLTDKIAPRKMIGMGVLISGLSTLIFGFSSALTLMTILMFINGLFQATGWSTNVKLVYGWFKEKERRKASGILGSSYQWGNTFAWLLAGTIAFYFGWRELFWIPAILFFVISIPYLIFVRKGEHVRKTKVKEQMKVFITPSILITGLALLFLNIVRYGFFVWIPAYLFEIEGHNIFTSSLKALLIPLVGSVGGIAGGYLKISKEKLAGMSLMTLAVLIIAFFYIHIPIASLVIISAIGFFTYLPHVIIVTTCPMDYEATGSATGLIDGLGYIGATVTSILSGFLIENYGWLSGFCFWAVISLLASICILFVKRLKK